MSDIRILPGRGARDPVALLEAAKSAGLIDVVILGWDSDKERFFASSCEHMHEIQWILANGEVGFWELVAEARELDREEDGGDESA